MGGRIMTFEEKQKQAEKYSDTIRALADDALINRSQPAEVIDALKAGAESLEDQSWFWCAKTMIQGAQHMMEKSQQEKLCRDQAKFHPVDEFKCSACGIHLAEWVRKETDEETGDVINCEYEPKFCPNCGRKIRRDEE
jgi:membrane protease subunit (stomatin/prohibitin family)